MSEGTPIIPASPVGSIRGPCGGRAVYEADADRPGSDKGAVCYPRVESHVELEPALGVGNGYDILQDPSTADEFHDGVRHSSHLVGHIR